MVPCTGRIDILHLLQAFEVGADTVFVSGCHEGDCHYVAGNYYARKRVERVKEILQKVGLEPERVEMFHVSASEGPKFAAVAQEMTERAYKLGPNPVQREGSGRLAGPATGCRGCGMKRLIKGEEMEPTDFPKILAMLLPLVLLCRGRSGGQHAPAIPAGNQDYVGAVHRAGGHPAPAQGL